MKYSFHPSEITELQEAINYYEECQSGLGLEFAREIYSTIQRIIHFSEAWPNLSGNTRRCLSKRFPYGVIYQIAENEIFIIAIMQQNREPDYWEKRVK